MAGAGDLDTLVRIMRMGQGADDGYGGLLPAAPVELAQAWARILPISGRERVAAAQLEAPALYRITLYRRDDLTEADWIEEVASGRRYDIRFLPRGPARDLTMTLDCETGSVTGGTAGGAGGS